MTRERLLELAKVEEKCESIGVGGLLIDVGLYTEGENKFMKYSRDYWERLSYAALRMAIEKDKNEA